MVASWSDLLSDRIPIKERVSLTIGVFDGLHRGHRRLMEAVCESREVSRPVVLTFRRSPASILGRVRPTGLILTHAQKLARLESVGISAVVAIDFSDEMSKLSGRTFIDLLRKNISIDRIVVGRNFRFGRDREADAEDLGKILSGTGIELRVTEPVLHRGEIISSSRIRKNVHEACFSEARAMLAVPYSLDLRGSRARREAGGALIMDRGEIAQVLPAGGNFSVTCIAADGNRTAGALGIRETSIELASEDARGEIEFVDFS